jgi:small subunit ribosomal protein S1
MVVDGVVTNRVEFGVFVRVEEGIEGLIHISELTSGDPTIVSPLEGVQPGKKVKVRILSVDPEHQRMGLSLRGVDPGETGYETQPDSPVELEQRFPDGAANSF